MTRTPSNAVELIESLTKRSVEIPCLVKGLYLTCWVPRDSKRDTYTSCFVSASEAYAAHRLSYHVHRDEIPADLQLDHLCRVHACWNPWHTEPVTPRVNTRRSIPYRRRKRRKCAISAMTKTMYSRREAANHADVSVRTVARWLADGLLSKHTDRRGRVYVDPQELEELITPQPAETRVP